MVVICLDEPGEKSGTGPADIHQGGDRLRASQKHSVGRSVARDTIGSSPMPG